MNASPDGSARKRRLASAVAFALVLALLGTNLYTFSFFWYRELDRANADYQRRRLQIEDAPVRAVDVVFAGDSFIEEGFWSQWYPDVAIANVGARGTTAHAMYYRRHHITRAQPAKVFVMVGINDLNISGLRLGTDRLKQMYALLLQDMADSMPRARVHVHAILPTARLGRGTSASMSWGR